MHSTRKERRGGGAPSYTIGQDCSSGAVGHDECPDPSSDPIQVHTLCVKEPEDEGPFTQTPARPLFQINSAQEAKHQPRQKAAA